MSAGKMPIQEKIAELESRIRALEEGQRPTISSVTCTVTDFEANPYWRGLWKNFDGLCKSIFQKGKIK